MHLWRYSDPDPVAFQGLAGSENGKLAIVAIFKNEAPYLREWLDFHVFAGADHFILYNNGSTDDGADVIGNHPRHSSISLIPWDTFIAKLNVQRLAYQHAVVNFAARFQWMAFIDIDEFLFSPTSRSVKDVLAEFEEFSVIAVPRFDFGTQGFSASPDGPVTQSYRTALFSDARDSYKSIVRPAQISAVRTHVFKSNRRTIRISPTGNGQYLRINHYFSKSEEEFARKLQRGWPQGSAQEQRSKLARLERIERLGRPDHSIDLISQTLASGSQKRR